MMANSFSKPSVWVTAELDPTPRNAQSTWACCACAIFRAGLVGIPLSCSQCRPPVCSFASVITCPTSQRGTVLVLTLVVLSCQHIALCVVYGVVPQ